jgi:hypothetical protein
MAINLATKYSGKVDEVFKKTSLTQKATNQDYEWQGVNAINIFGVGTMQMNNYNKDGGDHRYGPVNEIQNTKTLYPLTRDRSFTGSIDKRTNAETMGVMDAGKALRRQQDVVVTPEIDIYRLAAWAAAITANTAWVNTAASTKDTAYVDFLAVNGRISDLLVPITERIAFMTQTFYNYLKLSGFVVASDIAMSDRKSGDLGKVDNVEIVIVPSTYMPANVDLIITHPVATVSPMVLADYIMHEDAPGISGHLLEGRSVYDAFILTNKVNALAGHKTA